MRKIPTLFVRDPLARQFVTPQVTPGCEWVLAGEGVPTRKYDGTCVLIRRDGVNVKAFTRREVKPGAEPPAGWVEADHDEVTGKRIGWEPGGQSGFAQYLGSAIITALEEGTELLPGTYELCGPKVNRNPEGLSEHRLLRHADAELAGGISLETFDQCRRAVIDLGAVGWEGIVWHHPDGRMAKLKRRDFG